MTFKALRYESSPVDWCEPNYTVTPYIAEFWNVLSSLYFFAVAYWGHKSYKIAIEPKLYYIWILITLIGIGSILFHGTLSIAGQVIDEMSILIFIFYSFVLSTPIKKFNPTFRYIIVSIPIFIIFIFGSILFCINYPVLSHALTIFFMPTTTLAYLKKFKPNNDSEEYRIFKVSMAWFVVALLFWVTERLFCTSILQWSQGKLGFYIQLHALWHVTMANALWGFFMVAFIHRTKADSTKLYVPGYWEVHEKV